MFPFYTPSLKTAEKVKFIHHDQDIITHLGYVKKVS